MCMCVCLCVCVRVFTFISRLKNVHEGTSVRVCGRAKIYIAL